MSEWDELVLINYCHPNCEPMKNVMRLPRAEAFALAKKMAAENPDTTAFYRFADFENYYALRERQDAFLYERFLRLGGRPLDKHPLSFTVGPSGYLKDWFAGGTETRLLLKTVPEDRVSFTVGDSGAVFGREGTVELLLKRDLERLVSQSGGFAAFLAGTGKQYVEAQLWDVWPLSGL